METVFVVAGGEWQTPLVKRVHDMGFRTIDSNLYPDSPAFAYADKAEVADVLDRETNLRIGQTYQVDAILTDESDIAVPTVAYVAEQMGLAGIGTDMALLYTNKSKMREFCKRHGLSTPTYYVCKSAAEVERCASRISQKIVIKPVDSQSSRGVFVLEKAEDASQYYCVSSSYSRDKQSVIVETFIEGKEFTVDGIVINGKHHCLAISEKKHYSYNPCIASELFFSYSNSRFDYDRLRSQNDRLVELTGLPFGLTHAEYKYHNGRYYLIEIAARGGGTRISSHIVPLLTGVDNYGILIESALGHESIDVPDSIDEPYATCAVLKFLDLPTGGEVVAEINGVEEVLNSPSIVELRLEFEVGDKLPAVWDDRSRPGFYIAWAEDEEKLRDVIAWVDATLEIKLGQQPAE